MAEEYPLSDEKLDELFVKDIGSVTRIVEKLPKNDIVLPICTRWFHIFQQATPDEKLARNFMLLFMHKQLNDKSALCYPFTDSRSCQRDLNTLHKMSLRLQAGRSIDDDACETGYSKECSTPCSAPSSDPNSGRNRNSCTKEDIQKLMHLNSSMTRELQVLQRKKERLLQRREVCLTNIMTLNDYNQMYHKEISYMKNIFSCSAITALKMFADLAKPSTVEHIEYFMTIFKVLCEDQLDRQQIKQLDALLGHVQRDCIDHRTREKMCQQMGNEFDSLRADVSKKYKKIIKNQEAIQSQELCLSGMNYLMLLKKLFMDTFQGDAHVKSKVITFLQNEYDELDRD